MPKFLKRQKKKVNKKKSMTESALRAEMDQGDLDRLEIVEEYQIFEKKIFIDQLTSGMVCPLWDSNSGICLASKIPCMKTVITQIRPDCVCWVRDLMYQDYLITNNMLGDEYKFVEIGGDDIVTLGGEPG